MANVSLQPTTAPATSAPSFDNLIDRARELARDAEACAETTERERRVPEPLMAKMWDSQLLQIAQPAQWGGLQRNINELYQVIYEVARGCGSAGWTYCVLAGHAGLIAMFPPEAQAEVWGKNPQSAASSAVAPTLRAKPVDGGFMVEGDAPFSSGCDHADWCIAGGMALGEDNTPAPWMFLLPKESYSIIDDWFTVGLTGTGSKTLHVESVFVPNHRALPGSDGLFNGTAPFGLQAAMVGSARGGVDSFINTIRNKPGKFGAPPPAQSDLHQSAIGLSLGEITFAWEMLDKVTEESASYEYQQLPVPHDQVIRNRSAAATISRLALSSVERLFELSGGNGVYQNRLSRALRDVRTAANHVALNPNNASISAGQMALQSESGANPWANQK